VKIVSLEEFEEVLGGYSTISEHRPRGRVRHIVGNNDVLIPSYSHSLRDNATIENKISPIPSLMVSSTIVEQVKARVRRYRKGHF
jgi:hypothetical protein